MTDIRVTFELWAGPDVKYVSHTKEARRIAIRYMIPKVDADRMFEVDANLPNGLDTSLHRMIRKMANTALYDAYRRTGQYDRDLSRLQQGKTV